MGAVHSTQRGFRRTLSQYTVYYFPRLVLAEKRSGILSMGWKTFNKQKQYLAYSRKKLKCGHTLIKTFQLLNRGIVIYFVV